MASLWLTHHCFACISEGCLVFLDAKNGTYSLLSQDETNDVLAVLNSNTDDHKAFTHILPGNSSVVEALIEEGLLTPVAELGKPLSSLDHLRPWHEALGYSKWEREHLHFIDFFRFAKALFLAFILWKLLPFRFIYLLHKRRSKYFEYKESDISSSDDIQQLSNVFYQIAPFFFTTHDRCFLTSLTQMYFLRSYGLNAFWTIAVQADPFRAHCWTQVGTIAVGQDLSDIQLLRPILVI